MAKYRKRPLVIEAEQATERTVIETLEGDMTAEVGDWIITGIKGERYPIKADIFEATYVPATAPTGDMWKLLGWVGEIIFDRDGMGPIRVKESDEFEEFRTAFATLQTKVSHIESGWWETVTTEHAHMRDVEIPELDAGFNAERSIRKQYAETIKKLQSSEFKAWGLIPGLIEALEWGINATPTSSTRNRMTDRVIEARKAMEDK